MKRLSEGRPCDFTGIEGYDELDERGGVQWPYPASLGMKVNRGECDFVRERRLFEDGQFYHADGKARFLYDEPRPMPEPPDNHYPYILLTGRGTSSQWHTGTRTENPMCSVNCIQKIPTLKSILTMRWRSALRRVILLRWFRAAPRCKWPLWFWPVYNRAKFSCRCTIRRRIN